MPAFRPTGTRLIPELDKLYDLMKKCWSESPECRPDFQEIKKTMQIMQTGKGMWVSANGRVQELLVNVCVCVCVCVCVRERERNRDRDRDRERERERQTDRQTETERETERETEGEPNVHERVAKWPGLHSFLKILTLKCLWNEGNLLSLDMFT